MARMQQVSRREVLRMAGALAREYGESLTLTAFRRETGLSQWVIFDLFGNWKNLRVAAGLTPEAPRTRNRITREAILELARDQARIHGERLTELKFLAATGLSGRIVADRFGSWGELRTAAGLKPRAKVQRRYTEEEVLADLYRAWRHRGRPRYHQHQWNGGKIHPATIRERFGRWEVVVAAYEAYCRKLDGTRKPLPMGLSEPTWVPPEGYGEAGGGDEG
jgi:hypothetical protein